jgi:hypothetical protein
LAIGGAAAGYFLGMSYGFLTALAAILALLTAMSGVGLLRTACRCTDCGRRADEGLLRQSEIDSLKSRRSMLMIAFGALTIATLVLALGFLGEPKLRHVSPAGTWTATVPRTHWSIDSESSTMETPVGDLAQTRYAATSSNAEIWFYSMAHYELGADFVTLRTDVSLLDEFVGAIIAGIQGRIDEPRSVEDQGTIGREFVFRAVIDEIEVHGRLRIFKLDSEIVVLMYAGRDESARTAEAGDEFFRSFRYARN